MEEYKQIAFDIKYRPEIESGKYKVVTRKGQPVRITCWDALGNFPLTGLVKTYDNAEYEENNRWGIDGVHELTNCTSRDSGAYDKDLFILTDEPVLDDFEKMVKESMFYSSDYGPSDEDVRRQANKLLEYIATPGKIWAIKHWSVMLHKRQEGLSQFELKVLQVLEASGIFFLRGNNEEQKKALKKVAANLREITLEELYNSEIEKRKSNG